MCAQCIATAATVVGGAAGLRAVAAGETRQRIGVRGLRVATAVLVLAAILAAGLS